MLRNSTRLSPLLAAYVALGCAEVVVDEPEGGLDVASAGAAGQNSTPTPPASMGPLPTTPPTASPPSASSSGSGASPSGTGAAGGRGPGGAAPPAALPAPTPLPAAGAPGEVLLSDDFEDGDSSGWIADASDGDDVVGSWAVVDTDEGRAYAQLDDSFDDDSWAVGGNISWSDVYLETRFRFTSVSNIEDAVVMLALRFQSKENYYYVEYRGDGTVKIRKRVDGSEPELSSEDLGRIAVLGEWVDIGFRARGSSLQVTIGGVTVGMEVVDTDLVSGGVGLGVKESSAVEFDDVRVTVP